MQMIRNCLEGLLRMRYILIYTYHSKAGLSMSMISTSQSVTLDQLAIGQSALVSDVLADLSASAKDNTESSFDLVRRLKELGFVHGESVKILHRGYFGGEPLAVRIGQSTFALRRFEAALIGVSVAQNIETNSLPKAA
jgi:ferrous iron transport protein A